MVVAVALLVWCLAWVLRGHAVPRSSYAVAAGLVPVLVLLGWLVRRTSHEKAARVADAHFGLKDALASFLGFSKEKREGEFYALDAAQTAARVAALQPQAIPVTWPRRVLGLAVILLVASAGMAFRKPSPFVIEKLALEAETTLKTDEINQELEKQVEELLKTASDEEKELLKPEEWRQWMKQLEQTKDRKEALRQYAELERKIQEAAQKLSQHEQEQLLAKAAQELQQDAENKEIGRKLEEKNYRDAAADLKKLQLQADATKTDAAKKELARLKSAAQRLAAAARNHQQRSGKQGQGQQNTSQSQSPSAGNGQSGQQSQADGQQGASSSASLDQQMTALHDAVQQYEKSLQQNQNQSQCRSLCNSRLNQLCQSLSKSACQRDMMKKLLSLSQCTSKCQGYLSNKECQSLSQCMGQKPGGKKAGSGSVESRRSENELTQDNGSRDQLQGIKGQGPANTSIEAADSGTGAASRQVKLTEREWKRQLESFVQREDVPAEVKDGVKEYFKGIQQVGEGKPEAR
ncbi:MAG: hypothetical protein ACOYOF_18640 [Verrucomicrobiaceae bacterium]